nr:reverse transcriptase domain-containing protein [Tanacetum cinerariifolium]
PRSIQTWDDLVSKFINQFFPPSKTTNLHNEITIFQQRFDESFYEAWERFNDLLRACLHNGFFELHQLDTFYNALDVNNQDSLNSAAGGNFLDKMPRECLKIIESKSKVHQSRAKAVVAKVGTSSSTPAISSDVAELKDMVKALLLDPSSNSIYHSCSSQSSRAKLWTLPGNTISNPKEELKGITTRSGVAYQGPKTPSPPKQGTKVTKDQVQNPSSQNTAPVQPSIIQYESQASVSEPVVAPVSAPMPNLKPFIPYPSRRDNEKHHDQAKEQIKKFYEIFKEMSFEISFTDALILMPKFASTLKALIGNKEKLYEMARTTMNEHCSAVILSKLPRKLGDLGKFLIPCEFSGMDECLALADLVSKPIGIAKDVSFKVGVFHFPADFVVVDYEPDPRVPLILGRCFLKTSRALIDVHKGELTLRIENEAITYNLDQTVRYSANYNQMTANKINVIKSTCEEYSQEDSDFLLFEEADAFLGLEDDPDSSKINTFYYDPKGDILLLEDILNSEPSPPLPNQEQNLPSFKEELKAYEAQTVKSSVDEPLEVELKDLPHHLEYAFLEGDNKFPIIIAKELRKEDYKPTVQNQRWVNPKIYDVIKKEVEKLLDARLIYPISDSPWVSPVHCVPKKGGFTVVENEENELIPTRLVTGWRVCIDYRKLNEATRKDHFPLPFMDQMLERLAGNEYYCFLDGFSRITRIVKSLSLSFIRVSHPQLHFGNPISKSYRLTFSFGLPHKWP